MQNKVKSFLMVFLGCKVNSYENESVAKDLIEKGYKFFDEKEEVSPDVVIINTCAVTETSVTKDKKMIRRCRKLYPNAIIVVMGCYSQYGADYIVNELKADIAIGTTNRNKIYNLIEEFSNNHKSIILHDEVTHDRTYEKLSINKFYTNTRAYVKIQDGCDNFCSYCLIPYVRGRSRSRKADEIIEEINTLVKNGYKEVVLTGIDMSSYGLDFESKISFSDLIEKILIECKDLYRLRISSLEESLIDEKFLYLLKTYPNLANHLHMPLQSGSEHVVKLMNRKYNIPLFEEKVKKIREIRPDISISTDVIVGFPQETEEDFLETYDFCNKIKFSKIHVFPYSDRKGTVASKMDGHIDPTIKKKRSTRLLNLSTMLEKEYASLFYDKEIDFLFETYDEKLGCYKGHSSNYLACAYKSREDLTNKVVSIKFNESNSIEF